MSDLAARADDGIRGTRHARGEDSRERLKQAAIALFANRNAKDVSTRDIVRLAGLKNISAIHYYFGSKENLLKEVIHDFTHEVEIEKNRSLDAMERAGGPKTIRDVLSIYTAYPSFVFNDEPARNKLLNYFEAIMIAHPEFLLETLESFRGSGSQRCLDHLKHFLAHLSPATLRQRLALMNLFIFTTLTSRETAGRLPPPRRGLWRDETMFDTFLDAVEGLLRQPASVSG